MRITVVGAGYVGLVTAVCFAHGEFPTLCFENDQARYRNLSLGRCPIYEKGLPQMMEAAMASGTLRFTNEAREAFTYGEIIFVCVGTPPGADGRPDLTALLNATREIGVFHTGEQIVVLKSTVPPGTTNALKENLSAIARTEKHEKLELVCNPEFLREGTAVQDFLAPDRIVVGADQAEAGQKVLDLYHALLDGSTEEILTSPINAELIKYACNSYLAVKLSFVNELAGLAEALRGDIDIITRAMGADLRIGRQYLSAGLGYGGACLPKDTLALLRLADEAGVPLTVLKSASEANRAIIPRLTERVCKRVAPNSRIAIWGVTFKAGTDDTRSSPSVALIRQLDRQLHCTFQIYDPAGSKTAPEELRPFLKKSPLDAAENADALIVAVPWPDFAQICLSDVIARMRGRLLFDFANVLKETEAIRTGFQYVTRGKQPGKTMFQPN